MKREAEVECSGSNTPSHVPLIIVQELHHRKWPALTQPALECGQLPAFGIIPHGTAVTSLRELTKLPLEINIKNNMS